MGWFQGTGLAFYRLLFITRAGVSGNYPGGWRRWIYFPIPARAAIAAAADRVLTSSFCNI